MIPICKDINGVIYKTTNTINGMWYIGKDEKDNPSYLGSGVYLSRAIAKYGKNNFKKEILDRSTNSTELAIMESKYIKEYNATNDSMSYNIAAGGQGGNTLIGMNIEDRAMLSTKLVESWSDLTIELKQNRITPMHNTIRGKPKSQEHKDKIAKTKTGVKQSVETIEKKRLISKHLYDSGIICPPRNIWVGKAHTEESKLKISKSKTGVKNKKTRLFSEQEQYEMKNLYNNNVRTGIIAEMFSTTGPTVLRYVREVI